MTRLLRSTFALPAILAVVSLFGLIAALTGDGVRDAASWVALGVPVVVILWAWKRRR